MVCRSLLKCVLQPITHVPADLDLFIVLMIPASEEFCKLAALDILDYYSKAL